MNEREIRELAAILVNEHGEEALKVAEARRLQHADARASDAFRLWSSIASAAALLLAHRPERARRC
ncbi:MAG: hypothetical protein JO038_07975 [Alphaproteobacteria bacterium]|nr:hypothetical protein [Alphaproteobacteria bacterium]